MSDKEEIEISQEAKDEFAEIKSRCEKEARIKQIPGVYIKQLELSLLEQIQLKINWNKAAQRQK